MNNELKSGAPYVLPNSNLAVVSLISGILGLTVLPLVGSVIALVTGYMAKREIQESAGTLGGEGLATAGLVMGWLSIGLAIVGICLAGAIIAISLCLIFIPVSQSFSIIPWMASLLV